MSRILLVEDDKNLLESLRSFLSYEGYEVTPATCLEEARVADEKASVVVLDWMLPDGQGIELLKEKRFQCPVILLTARNDLIDKVLALEMGADDYVVKPFEPRELLARIRARLRTRTGAPEQTIERSGISLSPTTRETIFEGEKVVLTKMEFSLLRLFMESPGQVHSREELLNRVWGYDNFPTTRTIDTHVLALRTKFRPEFFETIRGIGYRMN